MATTRDYTDYLNDQVDIAPVNSQEEVQAAELIESLFVQHGLETQIQEFDAPSLSGLTQRIYLILMFVGIVLAGFLGTIAQVIGLVITGIAFALLLLVRTGNDVLASIGPQARSQNVIGVHRATGPNVVKGARRIVIIAHYDTPRENFLSNRQLAKWQPLIKRLSWPLTIFVLVMALLQPIPFLPVVVRHVLWALGVLCALPLLLLGASAVYERFAACTTGASDNKSSVAAMLGVLDMVRPADDDAKQWAASNPKSVRKSLGDSYEEQVYDEEYAEGYDEEYDESWDESQAQADVVPQDEYDQSYEQYEAYEDEAPVEEPVAAQDYDAAETDEEAYAEAPAEELPEEDFDDAYQPFDDVYDESIPEEESYEGDDAGAMGGMRERLSALRDKVPFLNKHVEEEPAVVEDDSSYVDEYGLESPHTVRRGAGVLSSLEVLPSTCEIVYENLSPREEVIARIEAEQFAALAPQSEEDYEQGDEVQLAGEAAGLGERALGVVGAVRDWFVNLGTRIRDFFVGLVAKLREGRTVPTIEKGNVESYTYDSVDGNANTTDSPAVDDEAADYAETGEYAEDSYDLYDGVYDYESEEELAPEEAVNEDEYAAVEEPSDLDGTAEMQMDSAAVRSIRTEPLVDEIPDTYATQLDVEAAEPVPAVTEAEVVQPAPVATDTESEQPEPEDDLAAQEPEMAEADADAADAGEYQPALSAEEAMAADAAAAMAAPEDMYVPFVEAVDEHDGAQEEPHYFGDAPEQDIYDEPYVSDTSDEYPYEPGEDEVYSGEWADEGDVYGEAYQYESEPEDADHTEGGYYEPQVHITDELDEWVLPPLEVPDAEYEILDDTMPDDGVEVEVVDVDSLGVDEGGHVAYDQMDVVDEYQDVPDAPAYDEMELQEDPYIEPAAPTSDIDAVLDERVAYAEPAYADPEPAFAEPAYAEEVAGHYELVEDDGMAEAAYEADEAPVELTETFAPEASADEPMADEPATIDVAQDVVFAVDEPDADDVVEPEPVRLWTPSPDLGADVLGDQMTDEFDSQQGEEVYDEEAYAEESYDESDTTLTFQALSRDDAVTARVEADQADREASSILHELFATGPTRFYDPIPEEPAPAPRPVDELHDMFSAMPDIEPAAVAEPEQPVYAEPEPEPVAEYVAETEAADEPVEELPIHDEEPLTEPAAEVVEQTLEVEDDYVEPVVAAPVDEEPVSSVEPEEAQIAPEPGEDVAFAEPEEAVDEPEQWFEADVPEVAAEDDQVIDFEPEPTVVDAAPLDEEPVAEPAAEAEEPEYVEESAAEYVEELGEPADVVEDEAPSVAEAADEDVEAPLAEDATAEEASSLMDGLIFSSEGDAPAEGDFDRDLTGLTVSSLASEADVEDSIPEASEHIPRPRAVDDPDWGRSNFKPSVMSAGRRAMLLDLPDPSVMAVDPLRADDGMDAEEADAVRVNSETARRLDVLRKVPSPLDEPTGPIGVDLDRTLPDLPDVSAEEAPSAAQADEEPNMPRYNQGGQGVGSRAPKKNAKRKMRFGHKRRNDDQQVESMGEWLGLGDDYDAKKDGRQIGSWDNFDDERPGKWKGGATLRAGLRDDQPLDDEPSLGLPNFDSLDLTTDMDAYDEQPMPPEEEVEVVDAETMEDLREAILSIGDDDLVAHDIWFVGVGASQLDHAGIKAFLDEHRRDIRGCFLVNLDSVGAGNLTLLTSEGMSGKRRADRRMGRLITNIADALHIDLGRADYSWDETDATPALRRAVRVCTLMGMSNDGVPARSHTAEDEPEYLDDQQIANVADIVAELIRRS